jgi:outer membrane lipoprotein-sorting protein
MIWVLLLAGELSAGAIVARVKETEGRVRDLSTRVEMEIHHQGKTRSRVFDLLLRREGVNYRAVITLLEPPELAGTRFLIVAERGKRNRQWAYFPDLESVRPIAGRDQDDAFLGSDLTYADLAGGAHLDDLTHRLVGEEEVDGARCYVMEGIPRHPIAYAKLKGWVRQDLFLTVRAQLFDRAGRPLKEARLSEIARFDGIPLAQRIEMKSLAGDSRTVLSLNETKLNQGLPADRFSEEALAR